MYNAAVIGAGPAGYTCAIRLAQLGKSVVLIERDLVGGICINWGCTPSKAMIASAKFARHVFLGEEYGIRTGPVSVDFSQVVKRRDAVISHARDDVGRLIEHWGIELVAGEAQVLDPHTVKVGTKGYQAENIIYATGSTPIVPPFVKHNDESVISSNELVTIKELPKQLTIIGGGIIAFEIATVFAHLGTKVRIIELSCDCLTCLDTDVGRVITKEMEHIGVEILTNHKVISLDHGKLTLENQLSKLSSLSPEATPMRQEHGVKDKPGLNPAYLVPNTIYELSSPLNLVAVGRKPMLNEEEFKRLGIEYAPRGVTVNDFLQTNIANIYAIGDSTGKSILAHVAIEQALVAAEHIHWSYQVSSSSRKTNNNGTMNDPPQSPLPPQGGSRRMRYDVIPAVIYTIPEGATVGFTPHSEPPIIRNVRYPFTANLRANIDGNTEGFAKLWIDTTTDKLVGAQVVHEYAGEIIQAYANIIALGLDLAAVANTIHAHPTYNEIVRNSLEYALGRGIEYH